MKRFVFVPIGLLGMSLLSGCAILVDQKSRLPAAAPLELADPVLNQRRVFVVGNLTEASAAETIRQLFYLDAQSDGPIDLYLMTPGGDLKAAFAVVHALQLIRARVNTWALGECNSSGAVLLASGTGERRAFDGASIVIHGMDVRGKPPARYTELTQDSYTAFWRRCARLPESWLPLAPGRLFVLSASEAREYRVIDEIVPTPPPIPGAAGR